MRADVACPLPAPKAMGTTPPKAMALFVALPSTIDATADEHVEATVCPRAPCTRRAGDQPATRPQA